MVNTQDLLLHPGKITDYEKTVNGYLITTENVNILITCYTPEIIRIRAIKDDFGPDLSYAVVLKPSGSFTLGEQNESLLLSTGKIQVQIMKDPFLIRFLNMNDEVINEDEPGLGITWIGEETTCFKKLQEDEKFIGLGEKTGKLNRRGKAFENWNKDCSAYPVNADPLYATFPFYIGIHHNLIYGIFFDNTFSSTFNFGASNDRFSSFGAETGEMNYYFISSSTVAGIIENYTLLTGRMKLPPLWSLGFHQCRYSYFPDKQVENLAREFRIRNIPCDVIWLDIHYMDNYKIFTVNKNRFPDFPGLVEKLGNEGFKVVVIVDPGVKVEEGYPVYDEGVKNNYFIKYPDGENWTAEVWPGKCYFPDFSNPEVRKWWGDLFKFYTNDGIEGFWIDMNEPSTWGSKEPHILQLDFDGRKGLMKEAHNIYGLLMAKSTYEGVSKLLGEKRTFVLTRSAYSGVQRYAAVWTGDNAATDDHILLSCRMINSMGLAGVSFAGADVGGFRGHTTAELFARWVSVGAFYPFFRIHSEYNTVSHEPWSFGEHVEDIARNYISLRYQLLPYIYSVFYESTQSGMPVSRSLAVYYPFEEKIYDMAYQNEFLFGPFILVAPVSSKSNFCKVFLPQGGWYVLETDHYFNGNEEIILESPLSRLPVFIKSGAIIPMQSAIQNTSQKNDGILYLHIYNASVETSFLFYEDDGITRDFEKGLFLKKLITFNPLKKEIIIGKDEGNFSSKFKTIRLVMHGFDEISSLYVNGVEKTAEYELKYKLNSINLDFENEQIIISY